MKKVGVPLESLHSGRSGPKLNLVPCVEAKRRPLTIDRDYTLLTLWRVDFNEGSGFEGEVWQLVNFGTGGNADWRRINHTNSGSGLGAITVDYIADEGENPIKPNGVGNIAFKAETVENHCQPIQILSRELNTVGVELQVARTVKGKPPNNLDAGVCSFDERFFKVSERGSVSLLGGFGHSIDSINVDFGTLPGTSKVVPTEVGELTFKGNVVPNGHNKNSPVATHSKNLNETSIDVQLSTTSQSPSKDCSNVGLCSFDSKYFKMKENGFVTVADTMGPSIDFIKVDSFSGAFHNLVGSNDSGALKISGQVVKAKSIPIQTRSEASNSITVDVQGASAVAPASEPETMSEVGMVSVDSSHFDLSDKAYLQMKEPFGAKEGAYGLGIKLANGNIVITKHDGTDLSDTNRGYVFIKSTLIPGTLKTFALTANIELPKGLLTTDLYGFTKKRATDENIPFWICGFMNLDESTFGFIYKRFPESIVLGRISMRKNTKDKWKVQDLVVDSGLFEMPTGHFGAAKGSYFKATNGSVPRWVEQKVYYSVNAEDKTCHVSYSFKNGSGGVGLVPLEMVLPFKSAILAHSGPHEILKDNNVRFWHTKGEPVLNCDFLDGSKDLCGSFVYHIEDGC